MQNPETPAPSPEPTPQPSPDPTPAPEPTTVAPDTQPDQPAQEDTSYRTRLQEASANLTASEIPSAEQVPRLLGAMLFEHDNGELPGPLHERFPDHYPNPNE